MTEPTGTLSSTSSSIGLVNPKSPTNVGSVLRAAGCFGASHIFYSGERYQRAKAFHTDTKNASDTVPLQHVDDILSLKRNDLTVVGIELVEGATPLNHFTHPENALYVFGPEDGSLSQAQVDQCDYVVYIPTQGCLNLAATVNIVLYDRMLKAKHIELGDELIRQSRDTNNRVRVKDKI